MDFVTAVKTCFHKYFTFSGRACRSEFWYFLLGLLIVTIVLLTIEVLFLGYDFDSEQFLPLSDSFSILTVIPSISVGSRRLHDINRTGWWQVVPLLILILLGISVALLGKISETVETISTDQGIQGAQANLDLYLAIPGVLCIISFIWILYLYAKKGTEGENRFGPDPLA